MGLDFSKRVADSAMEGACIPSWTYMLYGFSLQGTDCIALPLDVPFDHNSSPLEHALLE